MLRHFYVVLVALALIGGVAATQAATVKSSTGPPVSEDLNGLLGIHRVVVLQGRVMWRVPATPTPPARATAAAARPPVVSLVLVDHQAKEDANTQVVRAATVSSDGTVVRTSGGFHQLMASFEFATTPGTPDNMQPGIPSARYDLYCRYKNAPEQQCATNVYLSVDHTVHISADLGRPQIRGGAPPNPNALVYYITDRAADAPTDDVTQMFKADRATAICPSTLPNCLNYGMLTPVPRKANFAQRSPAPDLHSLVLAIDRQDPAHKPARLVLYIHGYNNSFAQAYRSASTFLAYATPAPGVTPAPVVFYSWPANGKTVKYLDDETNNTWSAVHFRGVLQGLLADPDAPPQIDVIAHSMGNRLLMDALVYLQESRAQAASIGSPASCIVGSADASDANRKDATGQFVCHHIGQVVSFEPDVDSATFFEGSEHAETIAEGFTLYGSRADYALELSRELHGHCRAGQLFCDLALPLAKNVNIIDASIFRCDFFGHSYWDASPTVEHDLGVLLSQGVMSNDPPGNARTPAVMEYVGQNADHSIPLAHYRFKAHQSGDDACGAGP